MRRELIRNIGIIAHIDAGKTTCTERILQHAGYIKQVGSVDRGNTVMDYLPQERARGITIAAAAITFPWLLKDSKLSSILPKCSPSNKPSSSNVKFNSTKSSATLPILNSYKINLIDTPGHVDFGVEVERSLRVLDGAVTILDASAGVEAQTLAVWRQAARMGIPRIAFINKIDKVGADPQGTLRDIHSKLGVIPLVLNSVTIEDDDQVAMEQPTVNLLNPALLDTLRDLDDQFLLLEPFQVTEQSVLEALQRVTEAGHGCPVFMGSALRDLGVCQLMDWGVIGCLPPPPLTPCSIKANGDGKDGLIAQAFKVVLDGNRGLLVYLRIHRGTLKAKDTLWNANKKVAERVQGVFKAMADDLVPCQAEEGVGEGDIAVVTGLKHTATCHTLLDVCAKGSGISLPGIVIPPPVFACSIYTTSSSAAASFSSSLPSRNNIEDGKKTAKELDEETQQHLHWLTLEDPSLRLRHDSQTGQCLLEGMGELHLEIAQHRLVREWRLSKLRFGPVLIAYQECLLPPSPLHSSSDKNEGGDGDLVNYSEEGEYMLRISVNIDQLHGTAQERLQGSCTLSMQTAMEDADGFIPDGPVTLTSDILLSEDQLKVFEVAKKTLLKGGPLEGHPLRALAFRLEAFQPSPLLPINLHAPTLQACLKAAVSQLFAQNMGFFRVCQPIMSLSIKCPVQHLGPITTDLHNGRQGQVLELLYPNPQTPLSTSTMSGQFSGSNANDDGVEIIGEAPLATLLGYASRMRSLSGGMASFSMHLKGYRTMKPKPIKKEKAALDEIEFEEDIDEEYEQEEDKYDDEDLETT